MIPLWHLLLLICIATPVSVSVIAARRASVGIAGYALALMVGLALGAFFGWTMWAAHWIVGNKIMRAAPARQEWYGGAFYFSKVLWSLLAAVVALRLTSVVLRLVF